MTAAFDATLARAQFPALSLTDEGKPRVYFDNPAGTQVPRQVIDRTVDCLTAMNANLGGYFKTTRDAGELVEGCTGPVPISTMRPPPPRSCSART